MTFLKKNLEKSWRKKLKENIEFNSNILRVRLLERCWTTQYHYDAFYLAYSVLVYSDNLTLVNITNGRLVIFSSVGCREHLD